MSRENDRAPLTTEISSPETEIDPQAPRRSDNASRDPDPSQADAAPDERLAIGERLSERLAIGERLSGRYRIERKLGEGGMGVVYLVIDEQVSGETFAVKVLKECLDAETLSQLREEVR